MLMLDRSRAAFNRYLPEKYPAERTSVIVATPHKVDSTWLSDIPPKKGRFSETFVSLNDLPTKRLPTKRLCRRFESHFQRR